MNSIPSRILRQLLVLLVSLLGAGAAQTSNPVYLDPSQPIEVRVDDLIGKMTLEEKASQLVNQARAIPRLNVPAYDWWSEALHGVANHSTNDWQIKRTSAAEAGAAAE